MINISGFTEFRRKLHISLCRLCINKHHHEVKTIQVLELWMKVDYEGPEVRPLYDVWEEVEELLKDGWNECEWEELLDEIKCQIHDALINTAYGMGMGVCPDEYAAKVRELLDIGDLRT